MKFVLSIRVIFTVIVLITKCQSKLISDRYELLRIRNVSDSGQDLCDISNFIPDHEQTNRGCVSRLGSKGIGLHIVFRAFNITFDIKAIRGRNSHPGLHREATFNVFALNGTELKRGLISEEVAVSNLFFGRMESKIECKVDGYIRENTWDIRATINCPLDDIYNIEPADLYFSAEEMSNKDFTHLAFKRSEVIEDVCPLKGNKPCLFNGAGVVVGPTSKEPIIQNQKSYSKSDHNENIASTKDRNCLMHLIADHTYSRFLKNNYPAIIAEIMMQINEVSLIFQSTDFNGDGKMDGLGLNVKKISIFIDDFRTGESKPYFLSDETYGAKEVLTKISQFSADDKPEICMTIGFVNRDFSSETTIGLSYMASPNPLGKMGGICEKTSNYTNIGRARLNTAFITNLNKGKILAVSICIITLAHEIGHGFGSYHDREACSSVTMNENYIMYQAPTNPTTDSNFQFSTCSILNMLPVIRNKGQCLDAGDEPYCGDGIVQRPREECDCGTTEECFFLDPCCLPRTSLNFSGYELRQMQEPSSCRINRELGFECSASADACCNSKCKIEKNRSRFCSIIDTGCISVSLCDGKSPYCPVGKQKPNGITCAGTSRVCNYGFCNKTACQERLLQDCICESPDEYQCAICCMDPADGVCLPAHHRGLYAHYGHKYYQLPGHPCDKGKGYCQTNGYCKQLIDHKVFDDTLKGLEDTGSVFARWMADESYIYFLIALLLVIIIVCCIAFPRFQKRAKNLWPFQRAVLLARERLAENETTAELRTLQAVQCSRLSALFPSVPFEEITSIERSSDSEEDMIKCLLGRGYPMRTMFYKTEISSEKDRAPEKNLPVAEDAIVYDSQKFT